MFARRNRRLTINQLEGQQMKTKPNGHYLRVVSICGVLGCATDDANPAVPLDDPESAPTKGAPVWTGEAALSLVAEANLGVSKRTVRFFEPTPGTLIELEMGPLEESQEAEPPGLDSVRRYEHLTGRPAPERLRAAQWRANIVAKEGTEPNHPPMIEPPAIEPAPYDKATRVREVAPSRQWFRDNYCVATDRRVFWWNYRSPTVFQANDVNMMKSGAFAAVGEVLFEVLYSPNGIGGSETFSARLPTGWYGGFRSTSSRDAYVLSRVIEVEDSDRHDHCVNYHY
jgi:hypothetical protein